MFSVFDSGNDHGCMDAAPYPTQTPGIGTHYAYASLPKARMLEGIIISLWVIVALRKCYPDAVTRRIRGKMAIGVFLTVAERRWRSVELCPKRLYLNKQPTPIGRGLSRKRPWVRGRTGRASPMMAAWAPCRPAFPRADCIRQSGFDERGACPVHFSTGDPLTGIASFSIGDRSKK